jgi:YidC/Oxa1 family membrane protein insertase
MRNKQLIIVMLGSMAVVMLWSYARMYLQAKYPHWYQPQQQSTQAPPGTGGAATGPATQTAVAAATAPARAAPRGEEAGVRLGSFALDQTAEPTDLRMGVEIDPAGAHVRSVTLNSLKQNPKKAEPYVFQRPYEQGGTAGWPLATRGITVDGVSHDLTGKWGLESAQPSGQPTRATYAVEVPVAGSDRPLVLRKTFELRPASHESLGYEMGVTHTLENPSGQALRVKLAMNGTVIPPPEGVRDLPEVVMGYNREGKQVVFDHKSVSGLKPEDPALELAKHKSDYPMLWVGMTSSYFDAIVRPSGAVGLGDVKARALAKASELGDKYYVALALETAEFSVPAAGTASVPAEVYLGPRSREVLRADYYEAFPRSYDQTLVLTSWFCAFCTWQWLINGLVWLLKGFHVVARDWGLAIVGLVVLVRLALHPITKASQVSMHKMTKMGPELERLKKKYGDNKEELNKAMMSFYREQGITPVLGCLPMLLQMPIWIALWSALQSTFELRHAPFLWGGTWIDDLSAPDRMIDFGRMIRIPLLSYAIGPIDGLNLLPFLLGVVFFLQHKFTPKPEKMTPEMEQQHKMMKWMTLLFPIFLYTGPSGLNLYILTSTGIGIWESKRVRDHIKAKEAREKAGPVIVDAPDRRADEGEGGVSPARPRGPRKPAPKAAGGWFANLQKRAEELMREAEKKKRG